MRLHELCETFDTVRPIKFEHGRNKLSYGFEVGGRGYHVTFVYRGGAWTVFLSRMKPTFRAMKDNDKIFSPTGEGGAFQVMGTLVHVLFKFIRGFRPDALKFQTKHEGLASLYKAMLQRNVSGLKELGYAITADGDNFTLKQVSR